MWSTLGAIACLSQRAGGLDGAEPALLGVAGAGDPALLVYPAYYCAVNAALAALIAVRRRTG